MPTEQQFFDVMRCIEEYLEAQEQLGAALKGGLLNIARGKYTLGPALGQQRYPGDMQASTLIRQVPATSPDVVYDDFELQSCCSCISEPSSKRKFDSEPADSPAAQQDEQPTPRQSSMDHSSGQHNPVTWFAALPPPAVRQAQKDFLTILQRVVDAANAVQRLQGSAMAYQAEPSEQSATADVS